MLSLDKLSKKKKKEKKRKVVEPLITKEESRDK